MVVSFILGLLLLFFYIFLRWTLRKYKAYKKVTAHVTHISQSTKNLSGDISIPCFTATVEFEYNGVSYTKEYKYGSNVTVSENDEKEMLFNPDTGDFLGADQVTIDKGAYIFTYAILGFSLLLMGIPISSWIAQVNSSYARWAEEIGSNLFVLVVGLLCIAVAVWRGSKELKFHFDLNGGKLRNINAVCVDYRRERDDGHYTYYPIFEYYIDGLPQRHESCVGSNGKRIQLGEKVTLYRYRETGEIVEKITCINILFTLVFGIIGLVCSIYSVLELLN